ncbi:hypothetical protein CKA32_000073 [Geitlerinema sp. FC II]|nr:hypothetical protein CKA32_000073 [Geitlerinema sp. FC II]
MLVMSIVLRFVDVDISFDYKDKFYNIVRSNPSLTVLSETLII